MNGGTLPALLVAVPMVVGFVGLTALTVALYWTHWRRRR